MFQVGMSVLRIHLFSAYHSMTIAIGAIRSSNDGPRSVDCMVVESLTAEFHFGILLASCERQALRGRRSERSDILIGCGNCMSMTDFSLADQCFESTVQDDCNVLTLLLLHGVELRVKIGKKKALPNWLLGYYQINSS